MKRINENNLTVARKGDCKMNACVEDNTLHLPWRLVKMFANLNNGEKDLLLKIFKRFQKFIKSDMLGRDDAWEMFRETHGWEAPSVEIPLKDLKNKRSKNYEWVARTLENLKDKYYGIELDEDRKMTNTRLFDCITIKGKNVCVKLDKYVWQQFLNLQIYKTIDIDVALRLKSIYSKRLYEMLVDNKSRITFDLDYLKHIFGVTSKYRQNSQFVARAIVRAQTEMKEADFCPFYFEYETKNLKNKLDKISFWVINKFVKPEEPSYSSRVVLNESIRDTVFSNFPKLEIRQDIEEKLVELQSVTTVSEACQRIQRLKECAEKLKSVGALRRSANAYFVGGLAKVVKELKVLIQNKNIHETAEPKPSKANGVEGYLYYNKVQVEKKASLAGMECDEFIAKYNFERIDNQTFRLKAI